MNKKIFGIILVLLLLFIPQTVFADFATCVMITDNTDIYIDLTESNMLEIRIYDPSGEREYAYALEEDEEKDILKYLQSNVEENEYAADLDIINTFFQEVNDTGYIFMYVTDDEIGTYYSYDRLLLSDEELDNGYLTQFIEKKMTEEKYGHQEEEPIITGDYVNSIDKELEEMTDIYESTKDFLPEIGMTVISMLASMCITPVVMIIIFINILKIIAKRTKGLDDRAQNLKNNTINTRRDINGNKPNIKRYQNTSKRKRDPWSNNNDDDNPFVVK